MSLLALSSCNEELNYLTHRDNKIYFSIENSSSQIESRNDIASYDNQRKRKYSVIKGDGQLEDFPIFIHSVSTEWGIEKQVDQKTLSRGQKNDRIEMYNSFGVFGFVDKDNNFDYSFPNYINNDKIIKINDSWTSIEDRYWPSKDCNIHFYAYAPYSDECDSLNVSFPHLNYIVPNNFDEQIDLLSGSSKVISVSPNHTDNVVLSMRHVLTSVRFELDCSDKKHFEPGIIKSITLKGIAGAGMYDMENSIWDISKESNRNFSIPLNFETNGYLSANKNILPISEAFLMLPQSFSNKSNACVEVVFEDNITKKPHNITFSLANSEWNMSENVVYRLSTNEKMIQHTFEIYSLDDNKTYESHNFNDLFTIDNNGADKELLISNYVDIVTNSSSEREPLPVSVYIDDVAWCKFFEDPNIEGHHPENGIYGYRLFVDEQLGKGDETLDIHDNALRGAEPLGSLALPFNLSNPSNPTEYKVYGTECTTANCYVINGAGRYCFPMVYGNAITSGVDNVKSYNPGPNPIQLNTGTNTRIYQKFYNHSGQIQKPLIQENGFAPDKAEIVWMDKPDLVSNVKIAQKDSYYYIEFSTLEQTDMTQGNAVIAAKKGETILWSWHIWVTDEKLGEHDVEIDGKSFMP